MELRIHPNGEVAESSSNPVVLTLGEAQSIPIYLVELLQFGAKTYIVNLYAPPQLLFIDGFYSYLP